MKLPTMHSTPSPPCYVFLRYKYIFWGTLFSKIANLWQSPRMTGQVSHQYETKWGIIAFHILMPIGLFYLFFLSMFYVVTPEVAKTAQRRTVGWLTNNELERMWKEPAVTYLSYRPSIYHEGLRNIIKILSGIAGSEPRFEPRASRTGKDTTNLTDHSAWGGME
jgi:hypothetical protein